MIDSLSGKFDLPMIRYTPYEIFSNQIPVFDINFISPMEDVGGDFINKDNKMVMAPICSRLVINTDDDTDYIDIYWLAMLFNGDSQVTVSDYVIDFKIGDTKSKIYLKTRAEVDAFIKEYNCRNSDKTKYIPLKDIVELADSWLDARNLKIEKVKYLQNEYDPTANLSIEAMREDIGISVVNTQQNDDGDVDTPNDVMTMKNIITVTEFKSTYKSSAAILQKSISTWYKVLLRVALVGLLSVLVYIGIRIIITAAAADKAKYKKMFINWLVAVCILFVLHYLMLFILSISGEITKIFLEETEPNIFVELPANTKIGDTQLEGADGNEATESNKPIWSCSFTGYLRLNAGAFGQEDKPELENMSYAVLYLIVVIYTCIFTFMYLRRVLYMAFLTMIAPLIALTYPLDKIKDSKAQALGLWLREYMFNALIQPIHLILYIMIVSNVMEYVEKYPIYAIVAMGFLLPAEKFIRKLFGFEKAGTVGQLADAAVGAALMSGVNKLSALNKPMSGQSTEKDGTGKLRTKDEDSDFEVPTVDIPQTVTPTQNPGGTGGGGGTPGRQVIEQAYNDLRSQGMGQEEIRQNLYTQFADHSLVDDVLNGTTGNNAGANQQPNTSGASRSAGGAGGTGTLGSLRVPQITPAGDRSGNRKFLSRLYSGAANVGYEAKKRTLKAKPLKTAGKFAGMAFGGATLGLLGLAAGVSTGNLGNVRKFTAAGLGVGVGVGGTWGQNIGEFASNQKDNFLSGYYGEEEYRNKKFDKNFLVSEDLRTMINSRDIHPEMSGGIAAEVKRTRAIAKEAQEYHAAGITDNDQIMACMKAGLTTSEGLYAIQLAKTMKKDKVNTPEKRTAYRKKYERAFDAQNNSPEMSKKIEDIWKTATNIRFK